MKVKNKCLYDLKKSIYEEAINTQSLTIFESSILGLEDAEISSEEYKTLVSKLYFLIEDICKMKTGFDAYVLITACGYFDRIEKLPGLFSLAALKYGNDWRLDAYQLVVEYITTFCGGFDKRENNSNYIPKDCNTQIKHIEEI